MPQSPTCVLLDIQDNIAIVTLNRPNKYNGLDWAMFSNIIRTIKILRKNKNIRAVILRGNGPAFCSGLDVMSIKKNPLFLLKLLIKPGMTISNAAQNVSYLWRKLPIPVIAVTHGKCYGGGLQIAMGADFRFSTPDCEFSILEAKWGLIPDMAGMLAWREVLRGDVLRDLTYTGRLVQADEAQKIGLITRIEDDPMQAALDYAKEITAHSPDSVAASKLLINHIWTANDKSVLKMETKLQKKVLGRWNQQAAASRNISKHPKEYQKRKIK